MQILTKTIMNPSMLADEVEMHDEQLTKELETGVRTGLRSAVHKINETARPREKE